MVTLKRRILDYSLAALCVLVPAVILHAGLRDPADLNGFDRAVLRVSSPLQAGVSWVVEGVGSVWNKYVWLIDVEDENRELRTENQRLRNQLAAARRMSSDSDVLERLVGLKRRTAAETVAARVVSASANSYFRILRVRLDRGEEQLREGLPVIDDRGLVGRIHKVYGSYSDVLLLADPQSSIAIVLPRTGSQGVLSGMGKDNAYSSRIEYLDRDKEVRVGDLVVTSGLGGELPAGIPVGTIAEVNTKEYGRYQEVEVGPAVDYGNLRSVLVLLAPPPPPDPDGERSPAPQRVGEVRAY
ncbi:MAG: rod shape-determining protein MreC [Deltaproteobacteria bacterium]|nr:rod shape-determining protein MreC [Deltaproteobacteria bacterium]